MGWRSNHAGEPKTSPCPRSARHVTLTKNQGGQHAGNSATEAALENQRLGALQGTRRDTLHARPDLDGYDLNSVASAVPSLTRAWHLPPAMFTVAFMWSSIGIIPKTPKPQNPKTPFQLRLFKLLVLVRLSVVSFWKFFILDYRLNFNFFLLRWRLKIFLRRFLRSNVIVLFLSILMLLLSNSVSVSCCCHVDREFLFWFFVSPRSEKHVAFSILGFKVFLLLQVAL